VRSEVFAVFNCQLIESLPRDFFGRYFSVLCDFVPREEPVHPQSQIAGFPLNYLCAFYQFLHSVWVLVGRTPVIQPNDPVLVHMDSLRQLFCSAL
jgi:hypothetical protein